MIHEHKYYSCTCDGCGVVVKGFPKGTSIYTLKTLSEILREKNWQIINKGFRYSHYCPPLRKVNNLLIKGEGLLFSYLWPNSWSTDWWKPTPNNRIRDLQKAGALIAAEIDRLNNR